MKSITVYVTAEFMQNRFDCLFLSIREIMCACELEVLLEE